MKRRLLESDGAGNHSFCRVCYAVIRPCGGNPDCIHVRLSLCPEHIRANSAGR